MKIVCITPCYLLKMILHSHPAIYWWRWFYTDTLLSTEDSLHSHPVFQIYVHILLSKDSLHLRCYLLKLVLHKLAPCCLSTEDSFTFTPSYLLNIGLHSHPAIYWNWFYVYTRYLLMMVLHEFAPCYLLKIVLHSHPAIYWRQFYIHTLLSTYDSLHSYSSIYWR